MSKVKNLLRRQISIQGGLFDNQIAEGSLDLSLAFRSELSKALSKCEGSRWQIAARISELTRHNVSKDMLDKYVSSNMAYALRAEILPAFCLVTNSLAPLEILVGPLGCQLIDAFENKQKRLADLVRKEARIRAEIDLLKKELGATNK